MKELNQLLLKKLEQSKESIKLQWSTPKNTNTRHFIIDNLLPDKVCLKMYQAFPRDGKGFNKKKSFREKKMTSAFFDKDQKILTEMFDAFQDNKVIELISNLINFKNLEADKSLYAGGLSMMSKGDFLNPHIDNSHNVDRNQYRRLNLLYYVTPEWHSELGGNFELWDETKNIPKIITSSFNRLIVMETNKSSWHSVSKILSNKKRCCISNYYYSYLSPDNTKYYHVTSFRGRPEEKLKTIYGNIDNFFRNSISKIFKVGRGKNLINKQR